ncbi:MAG: hypothetical protein AAGC96_00265 [Pseudomonadota bacterium]
MSRAVFSSFIAAGVVILVAAFIGTPETKLSQSADCDAAYGVDNCITGSVAAK